MGRDGAGGHMPWEAAGVYTGEGHGGPPGGRDRLGHQLPGAAFEAHQCDEPIRTQPPRLADMRGRAMPWVPGHTHAHTHVGDVDHPNLGTGQVNVEGFLPVRDELEGAHRGQPSQACPTAQGGFVVCPPGGCQYQWEILRVDPEDAEVRVVRVVPGHILQDLQELEPIWGGIGVRGARTCPGPLGPPSQLPPSPGSSSSAKATMWIPSMSSSWRGTWAGVTSRRVGTPVGGGLSGGAGKVMGAGPPHPSLPALTQVSYMLSGLSFRRVAL